MNHNQIGHSYANDKYMINLCINYVEHVEFPNGRHYEICFINQIQIILFTQIEPSSLFYIFTIKIELSYINR